jgi:LysM repeat protein
MSASTTVHQSPAVQSHKGQSHRVQSHKVQSQGVQPHALRPGVRQSHTVLPHAVRSQAASGQAGKPPRLRLTRRGRIVLIGFPLVLLAALLISLAGLLNSPAKAADTASGLSVTETVTVTVQPGESLWAIAVSADPNRDARDTIADIVQLNSLEDGKVMPGQQLFVPSARS